MGGWRETYLVRYTTRSESLPVVDIDVGGEVVDAEAEPDWWYWLSGRGRGSIRRRTNLFTVGLARLGVDGMDQPFVFVGSRLLIVPMRPDLRI